MRKIRPSISLRRLSLVKSFMNIIKRATIGRTRPMDDADKVKPRVITTIEGNIVRKCLLSENKKTIAKDIASPVSIPKNTGCPANPLERPTVLKSSPLLNKTTPKHEVAAPKIKHFNNVSNSLRIG